MSDEEDYDIGLVLDFYGIAFRGDRSGEQMIHCPIHEERKPSASLNLGKMLFNCHACGAKGDALTIIMHRDGVDYPTSKQVYETITGTSGQSVRGRSLEGSSSKRVPAGQGYKPRVNRKLPAGVRKRTDFGA